MYVVLVCSKPGCIFHKSHSQMRGRERLRTHNTGEAFTRRWLSFQSWMRNLVFFFFLNNMNFQFCGGGILVILKFLIRIPIVTRFQNALGSQRQANIMHQS